MQFNLFLRPSPFCWDMLQSNASGGVGSGGVRYHVCERTFKTNRKILFSQSFMILKAVRQQALTKAHYPAEFSSISESVFKITRNSQGSVLGQVGEKLKKEQDRAPLT